MTELAAPLSTFMAKAVGPGDLSGLTRLSGGANMESWAFDWAGGAYVLRRAPSADYMVGRPYGHSDEAALVIAASGIGAWGGAARVLRRDTPPSLHEIVHGDLDLDRSQLERIEVIESRFADRRPELVQRVQAANRELAAAIAASKGDSAVVQPAVGHFHDAMGDLQQATIAHIFEMRTVMTSAQAQRFDESLVDALTTDGE